MASPTLSDLLTPKTQEELIDVVLGYLQANGFPTTDWISGGVERTRTAAWVAALLDAATNYVPNVAAGGFVDKATGPWLRLLASDRFGTPFNDASRTVGTIALTNASAASYSVPAGGLIVRFNNTGNRYTNPAPVTIAGSTVTNVSVSSEFPNNSVAGYNYTDPNNSGISVVTSFPGVTAGNPGATFSPVAHAGSGTGTATPSGSPSASHLITVRIDTSGQAGAASWSYSLDGAAYVSAGAVTSAVIGGAGITVTLANGSVNPSFLTDNQYQFTAPGSWITQQGTDIEADPALASRCRNRWPSLSSVPTQGFYDALVRKASNQVTQTRVVTDTRVNNKVWLYCSGTGVTLPISVLQTIQSYVGAFAPETDFPVVVSPEPIAIAFAGTIYYDQAYINLNNINITSEVETALTAFVQATPINGTIRISEYIRTICDQAGTLYVDMSQPVTINAGTVDFPVVDGSGAPALAIVDGSSFSGLVFVAR